MIDENKIPELRERVKVWERLIQPDATEALDTIEKLLRVARAAQVISNSFKRMSKDHDEKLGKSFQEACENWDSLLQEPLEFGPLIQALADAGLDEELK